MKNNLSPAQADMTLLSQMMSQLDSYMSAQGKTNKEMTDLFTSTAQNNNNSVGFLQTLANAV